MIQHPTYIKILFLLFLSFGINFNLDGQKIYLQNLGFNASLDENINGLCDYEPARCKKPDFYRPEISFFYPDGNLYEYITKDQIDSVYIQFSKIDATTCEPIFISRLSLDPLTKWHPYTEFVLADHLGRIYFMMRSKPASINYVCRINNFQDTVIQYLIPFNQNLPEGVFISEIIFKKDEIYLFDRFNNRFIICDTLFNRIGVTATIPLPTSHFLSYPVNCDSSTTYFTFCSDTDMAHNGNGICLDNAFLGTYDFRTNTVTKICRINIKRRNTGYLNLSPISPIEFLTSETECDLLIDLDRDNSSGLFPYDFKPNRALCKEKSVGITDTDTYVQSSVFLDSIKLIIHGIKDPGMERLTRRFPNLSAQLIKLDDSSYVLKYIRLNLPWDPRFELINTLYEHTGVNRTPGIRRIEVMGFNSIKSGVKINSFVNVISNNPYSGRDTTISICGIKKLSGLSKIIGGQPGGTWSPGLVKADDYDSDLDKASSYTYVTGDTICGMDTAIVLIQRESTSIPITIQIDTVLCKKGTLSISGHAYLATGRYIQIVTNVKGCDSIVYQISIKENTIPPIKATRSSEICFAGDTVTVTIDSFYKNIRWTVRTLLTNDPNIVHINIPGEYLVSGTDKHGCLSFDTLLFRPPGFGIRTNDMLYLEFVNDRPLDVEYHGVKPASKYIWSPKEGLSCYDCGYPLLLDDKDRLYKVEAFSEVGCRYVDSILVTYLKDKYFFPNVISLQPSQGGNNNKFFIQSAISGTYDLQIFDRWGSVVYTLKDLLISDPSGGWLPSETGSPPGVYVYKVLLHTVKGDVLKAGDVTVLD